jgi:hypothetical protein
MWQISSPGSTFNARVGRHLRPGDVGPDLAPPLIDGHEGRIAVVMSAWEARQMR